jgi:transcriptional regulator with GAF, ATPase, and Fis domain
MPDSSGFGSQTESGIVIPCRYRGEEMNFVAQTSLDDDPPIMAGRVIFDYNRENLGNLDFTRSLKLRKSLTKPSAPQTGTPMLTLEDLGREHIIRLLALTGWRVSGESEAAKRLGLKPTTMDARMQKLGISRRVP